MMGERLQELRKDRGMSQDELATHLGISHYTVSSYECNRSDPDDKSKVIIAKLFDVSIDYLMGLTDEPASFNRDRNILQLPHYFSDDDITGIKNYVQYLKYKKEKEN